MSRLFSNSNHACERVAPLVFKGLDFAKLRAMTLDYDGERMREYGVSCGDWISRQAAGWEGEDSRERIEEAFGVCEEAMKKIKLYRPEEVRAYRIWGWGYDQTNLSNLRIIGEMGGFLIGQADHNLYKIPKSAEGAGSKGRNGTRKEYYRIDSVRITSWEKPYTEKEMAASEEYNLYHGR